MLNKKKIELSYRIHLKFNLSDTHISWKGYLIGSLIPKINTHLHCVQTDPAKNVWCGTLSLISQLIYDGMAKMFHLTAGNG
jgi:hypothetical protein